MYRSLIALFVLVLASSPLHAKASEQISVFIAAEEPGVAEFVATERQLRNRAPSKEQQSRYAADLSLAHSLLSRRIEPFVHKEQSRLRVALNGIRARVAPEHLDTLRSLPGVRSVTPLRHMELSNIDSVPWVQAPQLWKQLGDGDGITIAVIDSGVDYLHANFGGEGDPLDYATNNFAVIEGGSFPTSKVIGGWDFAGPTYNSREDDEPLPDPDPLDGHGHGSHVAGTAAGVGVFGRIGPGVAPGAQLLALKVFSDEGGSTDLTVDAIERALDPNGDGSIDDRVDVINMSLGARFGLPTDPSAVASSHAVRAGVIVVASAGNNGNLPYVIGSPGVSPEVITVAASISGGRNQIALATSLSDAPLMPALEGASPQKLGPEIIEKRLAIASDADSASEPSVACEPLSNADDLKGRAVLVARGSCLFPVKYANVQAAGGAAIVVVNTSDDVRDLSVMGGVFDPSITIPGLMITAADGNRLVEALGNSSEPLVQMSTLFKLPTPNDLDDVVASFSSQGPGAQNSGFKPDLAAPGRFTVSTLAGAGVEGVQRRGTSMAAPHVAGMAALLRQQHPELAPASIKALLQNAAHPSQQNGPGTNSPEPLSKQGVGVLRGATASALTSFIEPAGVSFGHINPLTDKSARHTVTLHNMTAKERIFTVQKIMAVEQPGINITCPDQVVVEALGTADIAIELSAIASELPADNGRSNVSEASGWCVFSDGQDQLRTGFVAAADGASQAVLQTPSLGIPSPGLFDECTSEKYRNHNTGKSQVLDSVTRIASSKQQSTHALPATQLINQGPAEAVAHSFVLIAEDEPGRPGDIAAFGWRNATLFTQPVFEIGVALKNPWDNPSNYRYFLRVDIDDDSIVERTLFAVDWSRLGFDPGTIVTGLDYISDFDDVGTDNSVSHWIAEDVDYNDRTIVLPWFNANSGVNAIFKPHERQLNVTLVVLDRYGNESSLSGTIDLDNPDGHIQGKHAIAPGASVPVTPGGHGQLWLIPTNRTHDQVQTVKSERLPRYVR